MLLTELRQEENPGVDFATLTAGSARELMWHCERDHVFPKKIMRRIHQGKILSCPECYKEDQQQNLLRVRFPNLFAEIHPTKNNGIDLDSLSYASAKELVWSCKKGHDWPARVYARAKENGSGCPECVARAYISAGEKELAQALRDSGINIVTTQRSIIQGRELGIYLPDEKIAVEYCGVYWHDEKKHHRNYHRDKWLACQEKGIQLIQICEDDWLNRREIVLKMLLYKSKRSSDAKIAARKTKLVTISQTQATLFMNQYHIQGSANASVRLGLMLEETQELVAVLLARQSKKNTYSITRYATNSTVMGGFSKLLKALERQYMPDKIITFSDHMVSDGKLYSSNGFVVDKELKPDYMYVIKGIRKHKFNYRLKRFRTDENLRWDPSLSESQLAILNKFPRVWDAGKTRWVKNYT